MAYYIQKTIVLRKPVPFQAKAALCFTIASLVLAKK